jgi:hypothetical protein
MCATHMQESKPSEKSDWTTGRQERIEGASGEAGQRLSPVLPFTGKGYHSDIVSHRARNLKF